MGVAPVKLVYDSSRDSRDFVGFEKITTKYVMEIMVFIVVQWFFMVCHFFIVFMVFSKNWISKNWTSKNWISRNWSSKNWISRNWISWNLVPELWYLNYGTWTLVPELLGLGVPGYFDPLGLGVPDCLLLCSSDGSCQLGSSEHHVTTKCLKKVLNRHITIMFLIYPETIFVRVGGNCS